MRRPFASFLVLACAGLVAAATPTPSPSGEELAEKYLVILGSKKDPREPVPALATLAAHPELGLHPGTLLSSRYKNLMPCYTVTYAAALPDLALARATTRQLSDIGVESYVKGTGPFVGPSAAIDAFCARKPGQGNLSFALARGGGTWFPVEVPEETEEALLTSAPRPRMVNNDYGTWEQPLAIRNAGDLTVGGTVPFVDLQTGAALTCRVERFAFLTAGTPHFGVLQAEAPPTSPPCGEPALMARLDCPSDGQILLRGETATLGVTPFEGEVTPPWAETVLAAHPDSRPVGEGWTRTVMVRKAGKLRVLEATLGTEEGLCGGTEYVLAGVFTAKGRPVVPLQRYEFSQVFGLLDVGGDGKPELLIHAFPEILQVVSADGSVLASQQVAFCDCPC